MQISNGINWQIESIRITAFINGQLNPSILETWLADVSENTPSQVNKTPSSFTGISRSMAGFLRVNWNAGRLDVIMSSQEPQLGHTIAAISEATSLFDRFVNRVPDIDELALVDRIALGLVLTFQVPSESYGLEILSPSIVCLKLPQSARDFLYRVNHPYISHTVDNLLLNRLVTWSVGQVQLIQVQINQDGSQVKQTITENPTAIRLELDINTDKKVQLGADSEKLRNLLNELKTIALNIANSGEVNMIE